MQALVRAEQALEDGLLNQLRQLRALLFQEGVDARDGLGAELRIGREVDREFVLLTETP